MSLVLKICWVIKQCQGDFSIQDKADKIRFAEVAGRIKFPLYPLGKRKLINRKNTHCRDPTPFIWHLFHYILKKYKNHYHP